MTVTELRDYSDLEFQACFRAYFAEIGITLRENTDVFRKMQRFADEQDMRCLALTENGKVFGFLQFQEETMTHPMGFFTERLGFLREFWIAPDRRGQGWGTRLLGAVEEALRTAGVRKLILTYEPSALGFYRKHGFQPDPSYTAANQQDVVTKLLD